MFSDHKDGQTESKRGAPLPPIQEHKTKSSITTLRYYAKTLEAIYKKRLRETEQKKSADCDVILESLKTLCSSQTEIKTLDEQSDRLLHETISSALFKMKNAMQKISENPKNALMPLRTLLDLKRIVSEKNFLPQLKKELAQSFALKNSANKQSESKTIEIKKAEPTINHFEKLLKIIRDTDYWAAKSNWSYTVPEGIKKLQRKLLEHPHTAQSDLFNILKVEAIARRDLKGLLYTLFGYDKRNPFTADFYAIFQEVQSIQDLGKNNKFGLIIADWEKFGEQKIEIILDSRIY